MYIQESIKQIFNYGLFGAVGAAEKKKIQTAISLHGQKNFFFKFFEKYCSVRTKKLHSKKVRFFLLLLFWKVVYFGLE